MKKILASLILLAIILASLVGCKGLYNYYFKDGDILDTDANITMGTYVPTTKLYDYRGVYSRDLETDEYGRKLIVVSLNNSLLYDTVTVAVMIIQKSDRKVHYYDDVFYFIHKSDAITFDNFEKSEISNEKIEALKTANDWQKPLNNSKMISRDNALTLGGYVDKDILLHDEKIIKKVSKAIGVEQLSLRFIDYDENEWMQKLMLYIAYVKNSENNYTAYLVITDAKYNFKYEKLENIYDYNEQVRNFKISCGWKY